MLKKQETYLRKSHLEDLIESISVEGKTKKYKTNPH